MYCVQRNTPYTRQATGHICVPLRQQLHRVVSSTIRALERRPVFKAPPSAGRAPGELRARGWRQGRRRDSLRAKAAAGGREGAFPHSGPPSVGLGGESTETAAATKRPAEGAGDFATHGTAASPARRRGRRVAARTFRPALYGTVLFGTVARQRPGGPMGSRARRRGPQSAGEAARVRRAAGPAGRGGCRGTVAGGSRGAPAPRGTRARRRAASCRALSLGLLWGYQGVRPGLRLRPARPGGRRSWLAELPRRPAGEPRSPGPAPPAWGQSADHARSVMCVNGCSEMRRLSFLPTASRRAAEVQ